MSEIISKKTSKVNKSNPDVLRVTEYILEQNKLDESFSVQSAAKSPDLNGVGRHNIAEIMRVICLEPNGKGSLIYCTTVDNQHLDNQFFKWQLNTQTYFSYLSYQSVEQAKISNKAAIKTLRIAIATMVIAIIIPVITSDCMSDISAYFRN
ncbi:hypothetical protein EI165_14430 [Pseudoalteromonas nigrifaciens]|uniref:hypothetical protein n=1 Tax=Pseudoalteromonas nigrifaciens TaxID=28109 RepID=UPI001787C252|nr:hypothetical protein [Pseudoalteromonas nigrifaciens]MBE0421309.1 hypothetical protein [Pseudoalteromonas nigrifaciens]